LKIDNSTASANVTVDEMIQEVKVNVTNSTVIVKSIYKFAVGFIAGLFGEHAPNTMACTSNFTRITNASMSLYDHLSQASNLTQLMNEIPVETRTVNGSLVEYTKLMDETRQSLKDSAVDFENILGSVHPIINGCYSSAFEFKDVTLSYIATFKNWQNLLISIVHKAGDLYDVIMFIIKDIKALPDITADNETIEFWYKIAIYFGLALKMVLDHPPADFFVADPADSFPSYDSF
jgi:hypothetical protein